MIDKKEDEKKPAAAPQRHIRYLDPRDCLETFADSITGVTFHGQTLRLEFAVTGIDDVKPNSPVSGRHYPVCRLVLQPHAAVGAALIKAGIVKATPLTSRQGNDER